MNAKTKRYCQLEVELLEDRTSPSHLAVVTVPFPQQGRVPDLEPVPASGTVEAVNHRVNFSEMPPGIIAILIGL
jgi:hypothetical protein